MAKKLTSVLGVDIGSQSIKIAEVRLQGKSPAVTALGMAPTPPGAVDQTGMHDAESVAQALKALIASSGASVADVVVSIAGQGSVLVRTLEVPAMNEAELKQHMDWEITRNIPFAESTVVNDFKAFPPEPTNPQNMDVVLAISPQSAIDNLIAAVKKSGRRPAAIDVEPLGIARALTLGYSQEFQGKSVCVVDVGHKTTAINVYKDGKLQMPRSVPIGGEMMTRSIADTLGVDFEQAEHMKAEAEIPDSPGAGGAAYNPFEASTATQAFTPYNPFADPDELAPEPTAAANPFEEAPPAAPAMADENPFETAPPPFETAAPNPVPYGGGDTRAYNAMAPVLDEFVAEVRRSIDYFRSKGGEVHEVLLCGGGAKMKGMTKFLEASLGLPCEEMDPLRGVTLSAKKLDAGLGSGRHSEFAVAVGNGLHICF